MGQKTEDGRENHQHMHEKITNPPLANEVSSLLGEDEERKIHRLGRWKEKVKRWFHMEIVVVKKGVVDLTAR